MRVAVIGASKDRSKFGNKAVRAHMSIGNEVFPINPAEKEIEGLRAFKTILEIPGDVDLVLMYVPPSIGIKVIEEIAKKGVKKIFFNPGTESPELAKKAGELGLEAVFGCAIRAVGINPDDL
ncbi:MAG: CoA-binding protein [Candidatus Micrarchaeota archaeon]